MATFETKNISISFINAGRFVQVVLGGTKKRKSGPSHERLPSPFTVLLFFHGVSVVDDAITAKKVRTHRRYTTGDRIGMVAMRVYDAFNALTRAAGMGGLATAITAKKVRTHRRYTTGDRIGMVAMSVYDAFNAITRATGMGGLTTSFSPYHFYKVYKARFFPLQSRDDGFAPVSQRQTLLPSDTP